MERTVVMAEGPRIRKEDLPPEFWCTAPAGPRHEMATEPTQAAEGEFEGSVAPVWEMRCMIEALRAAKGNVQAAAKDMGISRVTLYARIRRHGLNLETFRRPQEGGVFSDNEAAR